MLKGKAKTEAWQGRTFETSAVSSSAPGPAWALDPSRRTGLKKKTNDLRLKLETHYVSFRAKESQEASRKMNAFIFRSVCLAFAVRTVRPAELACPETGFCVIIAVAGSCLFYKLRNIRRWRGLGCDTHPSGCLRAAPSTFSLPPLNSSLLIPFSF